MFFAFPTNRLPVAVIFPVLRPGPSEAVFALELKDRFIWHGKRNRTGLPAEEEEAGTFDFTADRRGRGLNRARNPIFNKIHLRYDHEEAKYPGRQRKNGNWKSLFLPGRTSA